MGRLSIANWLSVVHSLTNARKPILERHFCLQSVRLRLHLDCHSSTGLLRAAPTN